MGAGCACVVRPCPEGRCGCVADVKLLLDARTPPSGADPEGGALGERDEIRLQTEPFGGEHATPTDQPPSDPYRRRREARISGHGNPWRRQPRPQRCRRSGPTRPCRPQVPHRGSPRDAGDTRRRAPGPLKAFLRQCKRRSDRRRITLTAAPTDCQNPGPRAARTAFCRSRSARHTAASTPLRLAASRATAAPVIIRIELRPRVDGDTLLLFATLHPREPKTQVSQTACRHWQGLDQVTDDHHKARRDECPSRFSN
jgi:hypothetical protein